MLKIAIIFAVNGAVLGGLLSRIPEIQAATGLTDAGLGLALIGIAIGVFVGSALMSPFVESHGTRRILLVALPCFAATPLLIALFAFDGLTLFCLFMVQGLGFAATNVTMNVEADRIEAATDRRILNRCHALWAVGFLAGSLGGTLAVSLSASTIVHFMVMAVGLAILALAATAILQPAPPRTHQGDDRRHVIAMPTASVLLIMGFAIAGLWLEGTVRNWSVIYLRDTYAPPEWIATLTLPVFVVFQIVGRLAADTLIERHNPVRVARALMIVTFLGVVIVVSGASVLLSLIGFALIGLGTSTAYPQAMSAAARLGDRPASVNVSSLATLQTILALISPPLIGAVASATDIRTAFMLLLPLPIVAFYFARFLGHQAK